MMRWSRPLATTASGRPSRISAAATSACSPDRSGSPVPPPAPIVGSIRFAHRRAYPDDSSCNTPPCANRADDLAGGVLLDVVTGALEQHGPVVAEVLLPAPPLGLAEGHVLRR